MVMKKRPNILFLMSDEHRADICGYAGNGVVHTPVLDQLAETGVVFTNAYTPSPICVPGRMCMMAGQLPKTCGCEYYGQDLPPGHMTFARRFSQYAYQTAAAGKLHHMGPDPLQGWNKRIGGDHMLHPDYIQDRKQEEFDRYMNPFNDGKWSDAKEIRRAGVGRARNAVNDEYTVLGAVNYIHQYFCDAYYDKPSDHRPLMLKVSLEQPHYPYLTSEEKFRYYLNRVTPYRNQELFDHPFLSKRKVIPGEDATLREIQRAVAAYYGMIETVDENYGKILNALEETGQNPDDWIIVYTADHGEMLGEHNIWEKQKFFEGSVRVPLIIRWPRGFSGGKTIDKNVNLCDLFATLCGLADLEVPAGLDSRSLVPLLQGDGSEWDNETVSQFGLQNVMVKHNHLKYQYYGTEMPEVLFDLSQNPEETVNYIDDPRYTEQVKKLRSRCMEYIGSKP
jgi:choline-sulfatase